MLYNTSSHYGAVSRWVHWLTAVLMLPTIPVGYYMTTLSEENPLYYRLLDLHQVTGLVIFCLFIVKSAWRFVSPNPDLSRVLHGIELRLAGIVHTLLYLSMAVVPVLGYLFATAQGDGIPVYGLFEIPGLVELNKTPAKIIIDMHAILAYTIAGLIVVHMLAALKHRYVDKTVMTKRMGL